MSAGGPEPAPRSSRAVFLDRDGTINVEVDYLHDPARCLLLPGVGEAIARLNRTGFTVIVVTNQAGVGRGKFPLTAIDEVHHRLDELLAPFDAHVDAYYYCPHHPDAACPCRKPLPGMIHEAAGTWGIDLGRSFMIGDKVSDVEAGIAAGCTAGLVLTGYGTKNLAECRSRGTEPAFIVADLGEAVAWILSAS